MAWSAPIIHAVGDVLSASDWNITSNDVSFLSGTTAATVGTSESTTSTSYTNLATVGPAVTLTTGTHAIVHMSAIVSNTTAGSSCFLGVAVSGASSFAAPAGSNLILWPVTFAGFTQTLTGMSYVTGLTAGSNTFTMKYQVSANTGSFQERTIAVIPLP